jgi:hypothetical protein
MFDAAGLNELANLRRNHPFSDAVVFGKIHPNNYTELRRRQLIFTIGPEMLFCKIVSSGFNEKQLAAMKDIATNQILQTLPRRTTIHPREQNS